jgi:hypothetical protein
MGTHRRFRYRATGSSSAAVGNMKMPGLQLRSVIVRGGLATLLASMIAFAAYFVSEIPERISPSNSPVTFGSLLGWIPFAFLFISILLNIWLLPGCAVVRSIMSRRNARGIRSALYVGMITGLVGCGTLFIFPALFKWPPRWEDVARNLTTSIECLFYVITWFISLELLSRRTKPVGSRNAACRAPVPSAWWRAGLTTTETLALVGVLAYASIAGGIRWGFIKFGGDGYYRVESEAQSPQKTTKAYCVYYVSPGGPFGDPCEKIYLLDASNPWSEKHRGLLVWQSGYLHVLGCEWTSERSLTVSIQAGSRGTYSEYSRNGFDVRTVSVPEP